MSKPVRVDAPAKRELTAAAQWYERQREGLGQEFLEAVEDALHRLHDQQDLGGPVPEVDPALDVRRVLLKRFPYSIIYLDKGDEIRVLAIAHGHRAPGYWQDR